MRCPHPVTTGRYGILRCLANLDHVCWVHRAACTHHQSGYSAQAGVSGDGAGRFGHGAQDIALELFKADAVVPACGLRVRWAVRQAGAAHLSLKLCLASGRVLQLPGMRGPAPSIAAWKGFHDCRMQKQ